MRWLILLLAALIATPAQAERVRERHFEAPIIMPGTDQRADEPRQLTEPSRPPERREAPETPTPRHAERR